MAIVDAKPYFTDAAIEQFLAVKSRGEFRREFGGGVRAFDKHTDTPMSKLRVFVWREADKKHIRVLDHKDKEVYKGSVDLT